MNELYEMLRGRHAESTTKNYMYYWKRYTDFVADGDPFKAENATKWRQHMVHNDGYSAGTINARIVAIRSVVNAYYQNGTVDKYVKYDFAEVETLPPSALRERRRKNNRVKISTPKMRKMCNMPNPNLHDPLLARDRAFLFVLATTGMRVGEACSIKIDDFREVGKGYMIDNVASKHAKELRTVPMSTEAYDAVQDWLHIRPVFSEYVFNACNRTKSADESSVLWNDSPLNTRSARRIVKKYGRKIGMPEIKPHDLRRFVGTQLAKKNIREAQRVLGHSDIATTMRYYVLDEVPEGVTEDLF